MKEEYDIVIIGGGTNSLSAAGYLGKCGLSVCILEDRAECGGGCENVEVMPGYRIDPHATYLYGAAAPAFEQLELHKFGFRLVNYKNYGGGITTDGRGLVAGIYDIENSIKSIAQFSENDANMMRVLYDANIQADIMAATLRAIYYTPPPPPEMKIPFQDMPISQITKEHFPYLYSEEIPKLSTMEILDMLFQTEQWKVIYAMGSWYNGPHPMWKGTGLEGMACNMLMSYSSGSPRGGMHSLTHALVRCAMHYGARIYTNSRVEEIIIEDGEAKGVRLADDATCPRKKIYAKKAVLSNTHVRRTFLDLIPSRELHPDFIERVKGINIKGGSLYVLSLVVKELPKFKPAADELFSDGRWPATIMINVDSREALLNHERDVHSLNTHSTKKENIVVPLSMHDIFDKSRSLGGDYHVISPIYLEVPAPEDHVDGPEAVNNAVDEINELILEKIREVAPNMTDDNIVAKFVNTPYDSELRNLGFVGGNWMGISQEEEQWYSKKPLPELSRYRTPIKNLYLCHQSSYPGGLALQAVSYNLMHILIEDLGLKPGGWWYPSPYFIPSNA